MKATSFLSGNCQDAPGLEKRCHPVKRPFCSRTGCAHFTLDGPFVTKQAQTYSPQLASALVQLFKGAWTAKYIGKMSIDVCGKR